MKLHKRRKKWQDPSWRQQERTADSAPVEGVVSKAHTRHPCKGGRSREMGTDASW